MQLSRHSFGTANPGYMIDAVRTLVGRELGIRYKGSVFGLLWAVLSPLGTVAVLHLLFTRILPLNIPHYAAFIYCGLLPWTWFQAVMQLSSSTLIDNRDLVRKPFFPRILLPGIVVVTNFTLYLLALPVLIGLLLLEGVMPSPLLLLLPLVWLVQMVLCLGFGVLIAAVGVMVRDVQHMLGIVMLLWFYLTPVFYDLNRVGVDGQRLLLLNPMTTIIQAHRDLAINGQLPNWTALGLCLLFGLALLAGGFQLFRSLEDAFIEEV